MGVGLIKGGNFNPTPIDRGQGSYILSSCHWSIFYYDMVCMTTCQLKKLKDSEKNNNILKVKDVIVFWKIYIFFKHR